MKHRTTSSLFINISIPLIVLSLSLSLLSCGGASSNTVAEGGISGTGITALGRITNFGSILVNGIRFNVDNATFDRDGDTLVGQSDFKIGEFVVINGTVKTDGMNGVATHVSFTDLLEGAVTSTSNNNSSLEVLGQTIETDQLTVFHGFKTLNDLQKGNIVEVSGTKNARGLVTASSISLIQSSFNSGSSENELKGKISRLNTRQQTFAINNIIINYASASLEGFNNRGLQNGQFIEAKSSLAISGNTLFADKIELENEYQNLDNNSEADIEGQVTHFTSITNFHINGLPVTTTSTTRFENGKATDIVLNSTLELEGNVNASGIIVADEISFEETKSAIELKGNLQSIHLSSNEIELNNQIIVLNASTLMIDELDQHSQTLTINDLRVGDHVEIKGIALSSGKILASKLEREDED